VQQFQVDARTRSPGRAVVRSSVTVTAAAANAGVSEATTQPRTTRKRPAPPRKVDPLTPAAAVCSVAAVTDIRKSIVKEGYDTLADRFLAWGQRVEGDPRERFLTELAKRLHDGARVLDLGCGAGIPSTKHLAERFEVVGVDLSEAQLRLARANVPHARFIHGDASELQFADETFDAVTAFYAISHIPREEHAALFGSVARWLRRGGLFLASLGVGDLSDWRGDWLGVPMFFSSYDAETNRRSVEAAGFRLVLDEVVSMKEPEGEAAFLWVLAQRL
jgi:ubiquinone/menaquinone biosynthesis C-methylase UbiE